MLKSIIIGCGAISVSHIRAIKDLNMSEIVAVCDIIDARAKETAKNVGCDKYYTDYKKMLSEESSENCVVHIATPHYLHCEMAIYAMEKGFDVFLEKPCAMTSIQAKKIIDVSDRTGKKVCVSFQNRVVNTTVTSKEIIDSGRIGKLVGMKGIVTWQRNGSYYTDSNWRGKWETEGGGVLINQSIHTLDMMYYLGGEVEMVQGSVALRKNADIIEVEDTAEATIWFKNGASAIFYATNCHVSSSPSELELVCEKGSLLIKNNTLYEVIDGKMTEICTNNKVEVGKAVWGSGHSALIRNFYKAVLGEEVYYCDIRDSYQVLEIIEKIYETSKNKLR